MDEKDFEMIVEEGLRLRNKHIRWDIIYVKKDDIYIIFMILYLLYMILFWIISNRLSFNSKVLIEYFATNLKTFL